MGFLIGMVPRFVVVALSAMILAGTLPARQGVAWQLVVLPTLVSALVRGEPHVAVLAAVLGAFVVEYVRPGVVAVRAGLERQAWKWLSRRPRHALTVSSMPRARTQIHHGPDQASLVSGCLGNLSSCRPWSLRRRFRQATTTPRSTTAIGCASTPMSSRGSAG